MRESRLSPRVIRDTVKRLVPVVLLLLLLVQGGRGARRQYTIAQSFDVRCSSLSAIVGLSYIAGPIQSAVRMEYFLSLPASKAKCLQPARRWQEHECGLVEKIRLEDAQRRGLIPPVPDPSESESSCFEPAAQNEFGLLRVLRFDEEVWFYWYDAVE